MVFKVERIDVKGEDVIDEKIDKAVAIMYQSESCHLKFLFLRIHQLNIQTYSTHIYRF